AMRRSACSNTLAMSSAKANSDVDHGWNHRDALRILQDVLRNALVRSLHDLVKDACRVVQALHDISTALFRLRVEFCRIVFAFLFFLLSFLLLLCCRVDAMACFFR